MNSRGLVSVFATLATITAVQAQGLSASPISQQPAPSQASVREQVVQDGNRVVPFRTCADVTCTDQSDFDTAGVCYETERYAVGVGIYPNAVDLTSDTNLTLALINGASDAASWQSVWEDEGFEDDRDYTGFNPPAIRHQLFVGAPADFDLREANPGCALMLLGRGQPFPVDDAIAYPLNSGTSYTEFLDEAYQIVTNTSWCPSRLYLQFSSIANYTREFRYTANSSLPRCDALAAYVEERIRESGGRYIEPYFTGFGSRGRPVSIEVIGGAISGPDASRESRGPARPRDRRYSIDSSGQQIGSEDCLPVLPESYGFYNVSTALMPLYPELPPKSNSDMFGSLGGRNGSTVVFTAVYSDGADSDPDVQYLCMSMLDPMGAGLPWQSFLLATSGGTSIGPTPLLVVVAAAIALALHF
ncbi:hypothetical protein B0A50_04833 [Salinomyces thailandicus]|uniref:Uncharacterized protein n=1 Tax=Salinomyces thailandicus TaxID=706561 RepID=A0A4U0U012_9PEZI|nr:hypothetical protein B0A50_04833 [Salinomyces thailandica]